MFRKLKRTLFPSKYVYRELVQLRRNQEKQNDLLIRMQKNLERLTARQEREDQAIQDEQLLALVRLVASQVPESKLNLLQNKAVEEERSFNLFLSLNRAESVALLGQDLWVIWELKGLKNGFFVEFTSPGSLPLTSSFLLQQSYGWRGILLDPQEWEARRLAPADTEERAETLNPPLFTNHLWNSRGAPHIIDYLALASTGGEIDILRGIDLEKNRIRLISVPHRFSPQRFQVFELLTEKGYRRKYTSNSQWEDWYTLIDDKV